MLQGGGGEGGWRKRGVGSEDAERCEGARPVRVEDRAGMEQATIRRGGERGREGRRKTRGGVAAAKRPMRGTTLARRSRGGAATMKRRRRCGAARLR